MIGVVLAGGASSRFAGRPKGLALLGGRAMALRVADVLFKFCGSVVIEAPRGAGYDALGLPLIHATPEHVGKGPLAALAAGLANTAAQHHVAFAPCDMPLLTPDIYETLIKAGGAGAYARTANGVEPLVAVLSGKVSAVLRAALAQDELPRTHAVLDRAGVRAIDFADAAPFANVNAPDDLARLEAIYSRRS